MNDRLRLVFTVINDLNYDQRMQRICTSLANNGFEVKLIGLKFNSSLNLKPTNFEQSRIKIYFKKSIFFYIEYNIKLFIYLLFTRADVYCAIDLDTIAPNYFASIIKGKKRVYDAHELFSELIEIVRRKRVKKVWDFVENFFVPKFTSGYTVNEFIKTELNKRYKVNYEVIRNLPTLKNSPESITNIDLTKKIIIYQGAVNEGRGFENVIPAMKNIDGQLHIYGVGNFFEQAKQITKFHQLEDKVLFFGAVLPENLKKITPLATLGITIFEANGLNQYYSLANRFFDYIMAGIPQICVGYPEYKYLNNRHKIAYLIDDIEINTISNAIKYIFENEVILRELKNNTLEARKVLNWENEELKLINFWKNICI